MTRPPLLVGLSEWAGHAAQVTTVVAGVSSAFGWVLVARFYGALGVEPEEVGITVSSLVVRAFLMGLLALLLVLAVRWLQRRAASAGSIDLVLSTDLVLAAGKDVRSLVVRLPLRGGLWVRGLTGFLVGFSVVFLAVLPFRLGDRFAADARAGVPVEFGVLGMSVIRVTPARLAAADPGAPAPTTDCVLRLGGNAGTSLFVVHGAVVRVSDQNVTVYSPC
ncbi:hypothetical protein [Actinosynnema sp. NPDC020468]|uniref:hypothetical protein n=1 Tax=Actinosynnema sp. NPDC020468 TaxID=3154488 RepID=UPI0033DEF1C9